MKLEIAIAFCLAIITGVALHAWNSVDEAKNDKLEPITLPGYAYFHVIASPDPSKPESTAVVQWRDLEDFVAKNPQASFSSIPGRGKIGDMSVLNEWNFEATKLDDARTKVDVVHFNGDHHTYSSYIVENEDIIPIKSEMAHGMVVTGQFILSILLAFLGGMWIVKGIKHFKKRSS